MLCRSNIIRRFTANLSNGNLLKNNMLYCDKKKERKDDKLDSDDILLNPGNHASPLNPIHPLNPINSISSNSSSSIVNDDNDGGCDIEYGND